MWGQGQTLQRLCEAHNLIYNLADFVNKIALCFDIWQSAKASTFEDEMRRQRGPANEFLLPCQ